MAHAPAETMVRVLPDIVQTEVVVVLNETDRPELAVALIFSVLLLKVTGTGWLKLMVCAPGETVKVCVTGVAARKELLPDWLAVMEQVPVAIRFIVPPDDTVHTVGEFDAKVTVRPDVAVALSVTEVVVSIWPGGAGKLMVCADWPGGVEPPPLPPPVLVAALMVKGS
jgi:hypothetical protein